MKSVILLLCFVSVALAMKAFHYPYKRQISSGCIDERGMYYRTHKLQNGYYVFKYFHVYPPGHPRYGRRYMGDEDEREPESEEDGNSNGDADIAEKAEVGQGSKQPNEVLSDAKN
uniref:Extracellular matrix phosphoglycoprotein 1 n=1 Tax=Lepisosteus oculatus TaxID=7918 RepID=A0A125R3L3_LEPOC|nr:extracellular matrix phosphoglycoprotein 1 [Lepisosteus oculatus]